MPLMVDPKVNVVSYGPKFEFKNGQNITPDEFVYAAANITYRDIGALQEFMELKKNDVNLEGKVKSALIKVAGAGHASMATTPGFWVFLEGTCSKLVDSMFTCARFGSSLMPSGRRIPISVDQIVVPRGIAEIGGEAEKLYLETSQKNIHLYEELQEKGIPKEEASKIVQYGHRGGGFMFMPLETFIYFSRLVEEEPRAFPREGKEIISQIENRMQEMGMNIIYQARKGAPRTSSVNPNIFHFRRNLAQELIDPDLDFNPYLVSMMHIPSKKRDEMIRDYLGTRKKAFSTKENIQKNWENLLTELDQIVRGYNDSVSVVTSTLTPWRVWGEVKRHRTLPQTAESIYHATQRAWNIINNNKKFDGRSIVSVPGPVRKNEEVHSKWMNAFYNSVKTYQRLLEIGAEESDAIMVIPRGIKLGVVKNFDLYNLTLGYMSLRLCDTAEPEMRKITEQERRLVQGSDLPEEIKDLIYAKCAYTGFCPEFPFERSCDRIKPIVPFYDEDLHNGVQKSIREDIKQRL